jgi:hypothetical protein
LFFKFNDTVSREEHKTIFSGLRFTEMALSNQSDFKRFFLLPASHLIRFSNTLRDGISGGEKMLVLSNPLVKFSIDLPETAHHGANSALSYKPESLRIFNLTCREHHNSMEHSSPSKVIFWGGTIPFCKPELLGSLKKLNCRGLKNAGNSLKMENAISEIFKRL